MAIALSGQGVLTFGALSAKFAAEDGFTIDGKTATTYECTQDDDTADEYGVGTITNFGNLSGQIAVLSTAFTQMKSLIGTSATLLWTGPIQVSGNTTEMTMTGTAILVSAPMTAPKNGLVKGAAVFQWSGDVTYTNESA
jgi:hypothetical protein